MALLLEIFLPFADYDNEIEIANNSFRNQLFICGANLVSTTAQERASEYDLMIIPHSSSRVSSSWHRDY